MGARNAGRDRGPGVPLTGARGLGAPLTAALWTLSATVLAMLGEAGPVQTVARRDLVLQFDPIDAAWRLPWWLVEWAAPLLLLMLLAGQVHGIGHRCASTSRSPALVQRLSWTVTIGLVLLALVAVWLLHLVRHDRLLTALHAGLVLAATALAVTGLWRAWRRSPPPAGRALGQVVGVAATALAAVVLALVSYGGVWAEARCGQGGELACLTSSGPRVAVPRLLRSLQIEVIADLRGADLRGAVLRGHDLRLADLRGARLDGADLSGANLRRARLEGIVAPGSTWRGAMLDGARFSGADLRQADWRGVHAYRIDLTGADLRHADARGASLSHAVLRDARLDGTQVGGAYLRFTEGWTTDQWAGTRPDGSTQWPQGAEAAIRR